MATIQFVGLLTLAVLALIATSYADPGHVHTKHVIHAPLHIKMIHHHKIIKVPVVFRKHHHHHKHLSEEHVYVPLKEKPKPVYEASEGHDEQQPVKIIKIFRPIVQQQESESSEGDSESHGHYSTQIGGSQGGSDYHSGSGKSDEYNSYEYDESQENGKYYYNSQH